MADRNGVLDSLEQWSGRAFVIGGLLMVVDAAFVAVTIVTGAEPFLVLGQAFVGTAWAVALIGLLGLYPGLADWSRWLSRVGAVFAAIGVVVFAVMAVASLVYYAGIPTGEYSDIGQFFIPGVLIGSVLGFVSFSIASLWTGIHSRTVGILLLVPPILVVTNILRFIAGLESTTLTLGIVIGDALAMLALGSLLRTEPTLTEHVEPAPDTPAR